jgi:hypothetical protein
LDFLLYSANFVPNRPAGAVTRHGATGVRPGIAAAGNFFASQPGGDRSPGQFNLELFGPATYNDKKC